MIIYFFNYLVILLYFFFFFSSRRRHTRFSRDWSSDVCSSDLANLAPVPRPAYRLGLPRGGSWREALNTDSDHYGGSSVGNMGAVVAEETPWHDQPYSVE